MKPPPNYTPSVLEVLSLVSLIPSPPPPPPDIDHLLSPILPCLTDPSLFNFIMSPGLHHVPFLSPTLPHASVTSAFSATRVAPPTLLPEPYPLDSHHIHGRKLYLPTITTDTITLGYGHMKILTTLGTFWDENIIPSCACSVPFRFIHHNPSETLFHFIDHPSMDRLYIEYSICITPTTSRFFLGEFNRSTLLLAAEETPTPTSLEDSIVFIQEDTRNRACIHCFTQSGVLCSCAVPVLTSPKHPFDFDHFKATMAMHSGLFESVTSKRVYDRPTGVRSSVLGSRMWIGGCVDAAFIDRVVDWAVIDYIKTRTDSPRLSLPLLQTGEKCYEVFYPPKVEKLLGRGMCERKYIQGEVSDRRWEIDEALRIRRFHQNTGRILENDMEKEMRVIEKVDVSSIHHLPNVESKNCGDLGRMQSSLNISELLVLPIELDELVMTEGLPTNVPSKSAETNIIASGNDNSNTENNQSQPPRTRIGPDVGPKMEKRIMKARIRREKNRACARRANIRAKEFRDSLLANLKSCHEQVKELRAKEMKLRQENMKLRQLVMDRS